MKKKTKIKFNKLFILICLIASLYFIRSLLLLGPIERLLMYLIIGIVLVIDSFFILKLFKGKKKSFITFITIFLTIIYIVIGANVSKIYSIISDINKEYITYSTSLVTLKQNSSNIKDIKDKTIGILNDTNSIEGYTLAHSIIKDNKLLDNNNKLIEYDSFNSMIAALLNKKVDYAFLPASYVDIFGSTEEFESLSNDTKVLTTETKNEKKDISKLEGSSKDITKPFTMLILGIDSTTNGLTNADSFNGDSIMVVTFNPKNLTATMLSIPRDTYVPIACFPGKYENKITHAASKGTQCMIDTIEDFIGIKIDYYMKINFTGVVDLVNSLEGVEVQVPYSFCEQNSKRQFGNKMIYVKEGRQTLNGEQALALSRNRKSNSEFCSSEWTKGTRNDFVRGANQQLVIQGIINKAKTITNINKIYDILEVISKNMDTNMSTSTMLSFYNIAKDILIRSKNSSELVAIEKLYVAGYGQTIYDERTGLQLWNYVPNKRSVTDFVKAMKENLELVDHTLIKEFSYTPSEEYVTPVTGKGPYQVYTTYDLLPDFTKMTKVQATSWANKYSITLNFKEVNNSSYSTGSIISQNYPVNKRCDKIDNKTVTLTIVNNTSEVTPPVKTKIDCTDPNNITNTACILPDFTGKTKSYVNTWAAKFSNVIIINYKEEENTLESNTITNQSITKGTTISDMVSGSMILTLTIAK